MKAVTSGWRLRLSTGTLWYLAAPVRYWRGTLPTHGCWAWNTPDTWVLRRDGGGRRLRRGGTATSAVSASRRRSNPTHRVTRPRETPRAALTRATHACCCAIRHGEGQSGRSASYRAFQLGASRKTIQSKFESAISSRPSTAITHPGTLTSATSCPYEGAQRGIS
jgi:hypothetical protein